MRYPLPSRHLLGRLLFASRAQFRSRKLSHETTSVGSRSHLVFEEHAGKHFGNLGGAACASQEDSIRHITPAMIPQLVLAMAACLKEYEKEEQKGPISLVLLDLFLSDALVSHTHDDDWASAFLVVIHV